MGHDDFQELTAAYALDALDGPDEIAYEEHLRACPQCRGELAALQDTAGLLAYGSAAVTPPPALRERILAQARSEQANVVPLRRRWGLPVAGGLAAAAAAAAIGVGIWAASLSSDLTGEREARAELEQIVSIVSDPASEGIPTSGGRGTLVVAPTGAAALIVSNLERAPAGKTYQIWVIENRKPKPAGLFDVEGRRTQVALTRTVPRGAIVAVTLEPEGGVLAPSGAPLFSAQSA